MLVRRLLIYAVGTVYVLNIGFGRSPTIVFEVGFVKSDSKNCELVPTRPACCGCKHENFLSRKTTVRFKLNLKTDGPDYKTIFKFGKHLERFHSTRKQCRRIYICELVGARPLHLLSQTVLSLKSPTGAFIAPQTRILLCKILVGNTQTLELHPGDAGCLKQIKRENCFTSCGIPHTATLPMPT